MAGKKSAARSNVKKKALSKSSGNPGPTVKKLGAASKPFTKTETLNAIVSLTGVAKKQVASVIEALEKVLEAHLKKGAAGMFTLPGLIKCVVVHKPATRARKGINPFTGEEQMFKAKPARNVVKVRALGKLKRMV